ncbi:efflux RND transporter periplasmic adaptor subunit [candidate division KSB1 bacterium]|nr:efflux RND transporter periplasmic adaptor subunit [candidate division KSB1 bacterium]
MKIRAIIFGLTIIVGIIIVGLTIQAKSDTTSADNTEKIPVNVSPVLQKQLSFPIKSSGRLAPKSESKLSFKIGGIIQSINVDEGQRVQKGQLLAQLNQAEIQANVQQAQSGFDKATRDLQRVKKLYADSVATLEQVQNATTGLNIAEANLNIAKFNLQYASIHAPMDGTILKRFNEPNELISAGMPVILFSGLNKDWVVRIGVSDRDILRVQPGDSALVTIDAFRDSIFTAQVSEIAEAADPMSGTFEIEVRLENPSLQLKAGFVASVTIIPSRKELAWIAPVEALVEGEKNRGFVYVVDQDHARKTPVEIIHLLGKTMALKADFSTTTRVVTEGAPYVTDQALITIASKM